MAYNAGSPYIHWVCPDMRGQLSLTDIHIPRSLKKQINKTLRSVNIEIRIDTAFEEVIKGCAEDTDARPETWINDQIANAFLALHKDGHAHSVEFWEDGALKGGLYGLAIGAAFFGESMFSRSANASKICLIHLVARLWKGGFTLLDTQFVNDHLEQFGIYEIPHDEYARLLRPAVKAKADFMLKGYSETSLLGEYFAMRKQEG